MPVGKERDEHKQPSAEELIAAAERAKQAPLILRPLNLIPVAYDSAYRAAAAVTEHALTLRPNLPHPQIAYENAGNATRDTIGYGNDLRLRLTPVRAPAPTAHEEEAGHGQGAQAMPPVASAQRAAQTVAAEAPARAVAAPMAAVPSRLRREGPVTEKDFTDAIGKLQDMKAPEELIGAIARAKEMRKNEPERAAMALSLAELFVNGQNLMPGKAVSRLDGLGSEADSAVMESFKKLVDLTIILADPNTKMDAQTLGAMRTPQGAYGALMLEFDSHHMALQERSADALRMGADKLTESYASLDLPLTFRGRMAAAIKDARDVADRIEGGGTGVPSQKEIDDSAIRLLELQKMSGTLASIQNPVLRTETSMAQSSAIDMLQANGDCPAYRLMVLGAEQIGSHGSDSAYRKKLAESISALAKAKDDPQEMEKAERRLRATIGAGLAQDIDRSASAYGGMIKVRLDAIGARLKSADVSSGEIEKGQLALEAIKNFQRSSAIPQQFREGVERIYARAFDALTERKDVEMAKAQLMLASLAIGKGKEQRADIESFSKRLAENPGEAPSAKVYASLDEVASGLRASMDKIPKSDKDRRREVSGILSGIERTRDNIAQGNLVASREEIEAVKKTINADPERKRDIETAAAQKGMGYEEALEIWAGMAANKIVMDRQSNLAAIGSVLANLPPARTESDKEVAKILGQAADALRNGDNVTGKALLEAAKSYGAAKDEKDRKGIIEVCRKLTGQEIAPQAALDVIALYNEKIEAGGKIEDPVLRARVAGYYDLAIKAAWNGDASGSRTLADLAAASTAWASVPENKLGKEEKAKRKQVLSQIEATVKEAREGVSSGKSLSEALGGEGKLAALDEYVRGLDKDRRALEFSRRSDALMSRADEKNWRPKREELERKAKAAEARGDGISAEYYSSRAADVDASLVRTATEKAKASLAEGTGLSAEAMRINDESERHRERSIALGAEAKEAERKADSQKGKPGEKALREKAAALREQAEKERKTADGLWENASAMMKRSKELVDRAGTMLSALEALDKNVRTCNTRRNELPIAPLASAVRISLAIADGYDVDHRGRIKTAAVAGAATVAAGGAKAKAAAEEKPGEAPVRITPGSRRYRELQALEAGSYRVGTVEAKKQDSIQSSRESGIRNSKEQTLDRAVTQAKGMMRTMLRDFSGNAKVREAALQEAKDRGSLDPSAAVDGIIERKRAAFQARLDAAVKSGDTAALRTLMKEIGSSMGIRVAAPEEKPEDTNGQPAVVLDPVRDGTEAFNRVRGLWYSENFRAASDQTRSANFHINSLAGLSNIAITESRLNSSHAAVIEGGRDSNFIYGGIWARSEENFANPVLLGQVIQYVKDDRKRDELAKRLKESEGDLARNPRDPAAIAKATEARRAILGELSSLGSGAIAGNESPTTGMPLTIGIEGIAHKISVGDMVFWNARRSWDEGLKIRESVKNHGDITTANRMLDGWNTQMDRNAASQGEDTQRVGNVLHAHKERIELAAEVRRLLPGTPEWDQNAPTTFEAFAGFFINRGIGIANIAPGLLNIALPKGYQIPKIEKVAETDAETKLKYERREAEKVRNQVAPLLANLSRQYGYNAERNDEAAADLSGDMHAVQRSGRFEMNPDFQINMLENLPGDIRSRYAKRIEAANSKTNAEERAIEVDRVWRDAASNHVSEMRGIARAFAGEERIADDELAQINSRITSVSVDSENATWRTSKERIKRQVMIATITDGKLQAIESDPDVESDMTKRSLRDGLRRMRDEALGTANAIVKDPYHLPEDSQWWAARSDVSQSRDLFEVLLRDSNIPPQEKERIASSLGQMHGDMELLMSSYRRLDDGRIVKAEMSQGEWDIAMRAYTQFSMLESDLISRLGNPGYQATAASDLNQITALQTRLGKFHDAAFTVADASTRSVGDRAVALDGANRLFEEGAPKVREGSEYKEQDKRTLAYYEAADRTVSNKTDAVEGVHTVAIIASFAFGGEIIELATAGYLAFGKLSEAGALVRQAGGFSEMTTLEGIKFGGDIGMAVALVGGPLLGSMARGFASESEAASVGARWASKESTYLRDMGDTATAEARTASAARLTSRSASYARMQAASGAIGSVVGTTLVVDGVTNALSGMPEIIDGIASGKMSVFSAVVKTWSAGTMILPGLHTLRNIRAAEGSVSPRRVSKVEYTVRTLLGENPWKIREESVQARQEQIAREAGRVTSSTTAYANHLVEVRDAVNNNKPLPLATSAEAIGDANLIDNFAARKAAQRAERQGQNEPAHVARPELPTQRDYADATREVAELSQYLRQVKNAAKNPYSQMAAKVKETTDLVQARAELGDQARPAAERGKDPLLSRENAEQQAMILLAREAKSRADPETHAARIKEVAGAISGARSIEATPSELAEAKFAIRMAELAGTDIEAVAKGMADLYASGNGRIIRGLDLTIRTLSNLEDVMAGKPGEISAKALAEALAEIKAAKAAMKEHPELFSEPIKKAIENAERDITSRIKEIGFNLEDRLSQEIDGDSNATANGLLSMLSSAAVGVIPQHEGEPTVATEKGQSGDIVVVRAADLEAAKQRLREREKNAKDERDPDWNLTLDDTKYSAAIREELKKDGYVVEENTIVQVEGSAFETIRANNTVIKKALEKSKGQVFTKGEGKSWYDALNSDSAQSVEWVRNLFGGRNEMDFGFMTTDKGRTWLTNVFRDLGDLGMLFYFRATADLAKEFGPEVVVKVAPQGSDEIIIAMPLTSAQRYAERHQKEFDDYASKRGGKPADEGALHKMMIDFALERYADGLGQKMLGFARSAGFKSGSPTEEAFSAVSTDRTQATVKIEFTPEGGKKVTYTRGEGQKKTRYDHLDIMLNDTETRKLIDKVDKATDNVAPGPQSDAVWRPLFERDPNALNLRDNLASQNKEDRASAVSTIKVFARLDTGREGEHVEPLPTDTKPDMVFMVRASEFQGPGQNAFRLMTLMAGKGAHNVEEQIAGPSVVNLFGHGAADAFDLFALNLRDNLRAAGVKDEDVRVYKVTGMGYGIKFKEGLPPRERARLEAIVNNGVASVTEKTLNDLQDRWTVAREGSKDNIVRGDRNSPRVRDNAPDRLPFRGLKVYKAENREAIDRMLDGDMFYGRSRRGEELPDALNTTMRFGLSLGHLSRGHSEDVLGPQWRGVALPGWARQPADFRSLGPTEERGLGLLDSALMAGARKPSAGKPAQQAEKPKAKPAEAQGRLPPGEVLRKQGEKAEEKPAAMQATGTGGRESAPAPGPRQAPRAAPVEGGGRKEAPKAPAPAAQTPQAKTEYTQSERERAQEILNLINNPKVRGIDTPPLDLTLAKTITLDPEYKNKKTDEEKIEFIIAMLRIWTLPPTPQGGPGSSGSAIGGPAAVSGGPAAPASAPAAQTPQAKTEYTQSERERAQEIFNLINNPKVSDIDTPPLDLTLAKTITLDPEYKNKKTVEEKIEFIIAMLRIVGGSPPSPSGGPAPIGPVIGGPAPISGGPAASTGGAGPQAAAPGPITAAASFTVAPNPQYFTSGVLALEAFLIGIVTGPNKDKDIDDLIALIPPGNKEGDDARASLAKMKGMKNDQARANAARQAVQKVNRVINIQVEVREQQKAGGAPGAVRTNIVVVASAKESQATESVEARMVIPEVSPAPGPREAPQPAQRAPRPGAVPAGEGMRPGEALEREPAPGETPLTPAQERAEKDRIERFTATDVVMAAETGNFHGLTPFQKKIAERLSKDEQFKREPDSENRVQIALKMLREAPDAADYQDRFGFGEDVGSAQDLTDIADSRFRKRIENILSRVENGDRYSGPELFLVDLDVANRLGADPNLPKDKVARRRYVFEEIKKAEIQRRKDLEAPPGEATQGQAPVPVQEPSEPATQASAPAISPGERISFRYTLSEYDRAEEIAASITDQSKAPSNGGDRDLASILRSDKNLPPPGDARTEYILRKMRENETGVSMDQLGARGVLRFEKTGGEMDPDLPVMLPPTYIFIVSTSWGNVKVKVDGNLSGENLLRAIDQETSKQKKSLAAFKMSQAETLFRQRLGVPMRQDIAFSERDASKPLDKALKEAAPMPQGHKPGEPVQAEEWENQRARSGMVKIVGGDLDFILTNAWDSRTNSIDVDKAKSILAQRTPRGDPEYAKMYADTLIEAANRIGKERDPRKIAQESAGIVDNTLLPRQPPQGPDQGPRGPTGRGPGTEAPAERGGATVIPIGAARGAKASSAANLDDARSFVTGASKADLDSLVRTDPSLKPQVEAIGKARSEAAKKVARNSLALLVANRMERGVLRIEKSEAEGKVDGTTGQPVMVTTYRAVAVEGNHAKEGEASRQTPQGEQSGSVSVRPSAPRPSGTREHGGPRPAVPSVKSEPVKNIFDLRHMFGARTANQELEAALPKGMDTNSMKISRTARALDRLASGERAAELPPDIQKAVDRIRTEKEKAAASGRKGDRERVAQLTLEYATRLVNAEEQAARSAKPARESFNDRTVAAKIEETYKSTDRVAALASLNPTERFAYDLALARARQAGRSEPISVDFSAAAMDAMAWHNKKDNVFSVATFKGVPLASEVTGAPHLDIRVFSKDGNTTYTVRVSGDKIEVIDVSGMKFRNDAEKEAFIRYANSRMADHTKSFGGQKEISDALQEIMKQVRNGNIGTAMRFARDLGDAISGSKARVEASRPADPEAAFKTLSTESRPPVPPQRAQAFRDFARMDADDKVAVIEKLLDAANAEERKGPAAANADYVKRLRTYASQLSALRTLNGETGALLERALGLKPGDLSAIYLNPAISDPHADFFKIIQRSGLILISGEGTDVRVYPGTKLKDMLVGMMTSNQGNLILTLLKMYPDASKIEMRPAGGIAGVTKVRITDSKGMHYEYIKPVDLQAAATGDANLQRSWVPTADTMTRTPDHKEPLSFRLPNGTRSEYGISRSITNSRIEIAGVTLETAFTSNIIDIKNNPEILKALGQHGDAFLEQLWFYITACMSSGSIDGHEANTFAMLMKVTNGNAQALRDRGFHFIPDGHGGEFVIMFGRIDTDDSAGSYWVKTDRHGSTDISSHIERSGGRGYLYRLMKEFVIQWNEAHPGVPPITTKDLSDRMFRQPVTGPGGAVSEPPAIAGSRRWMRIRGSDPAFVQGMEDGFRSHSGEGAGISFGITDDAMRQQFGTYGVAKGGYPANGEPGIIIVDQAGRTMAVAEYEPLVTTDEPIYRYLPKNRWSYIVEEIDMPPGADRSHANGTFQLGGKTFLSYSNIGDIPQELRDRSYAVHTHANVGDSTSLASGGMALWVAPRKSPGASGALRLTESVGIENYPMRGTIPSFRVMTSGGDVGAVNRTMRLGDVLDRTIANPPPTP